MSFRSKCIYYCVKTGLFVEWATLSLDFPHSQKIWSLLTFLFFVNQTAMKWGNLWEAVERDTRRGEHGRTVRTPPSTPGDPWEPVARQVAGWAIWEAEEVSVLSAEALSSHSTGQNSAFLPEPCPDFRSSARKGCYFKPRSSRVVLSQERLTGTPSTKNSRQWHLFGLIPFNP